MHGPRGARDVTNLITPAAPPGGLRFGGLFRGKSAEPLAQTRLTSQRRPPASTPRPIDLQLSGVALASLVAVAPSESLECRGGGLRFYAARAERTSHLSCLCCESIWKMPRWRWWWWRRWRRGGGLWRQKQISTILSRQLSVCLFVLFPQKPTTKKLANPPCDQLNCSVTLIKSRKRRHIKKKKKVLLA